MDVWKISETTARKLARDGAETKRILHFDRSSSSTLVSTAARAYLGLQNEAQRFAPELGLLQWAIIAAGVVSHITAVQRLAYTRRVILGGEGRRPLREDKVGV